MASSSSSLSTRPRVLILGTGIAGASLALKFADTSDVVLVAKDKRLEGSTRWAQGGIASVWSKQDSFEAHEQDTLKAGDGLCKPEIVKLTVHEGPARVRELIEYGVPFTTREGGHGHPGDPAEAFDLHREGGHGQRRILHADDLTGLAIVQTLHDRIRENRRITVLEDHVAIDLITEASREPSDSRTGRRNPARCLGAYVLDSTSGQVVAISADLTVLASGGAGKVYLYTTNPDLATGDGIAMAYRVGARVANMEFMQFHPTCLYHPEAKNFLITEAMRGEGAVLRNRAGQEFMQRYHEMASLAPRDVVARAIDAEMKRTGDPHVYLDPRPIVQKHGPDEMKKKFPNIYEKCLEFGIDITRDLIPVVPAAHYTCGGVLVDEWGRTSIPGLYAVGEVASTGLHGANRLASNSLLEAAVFADRVVKDGTKFIASQAARPRVPGPLPEWDIGRAVQLEEQIDIAATWHEIRWVMWNYVGIVRSDHRLQRARRRLEILKDEVNRYYWDYILTRDLIELRNLVLVADLIVQCATLRKESRGLHYNVNYPAKDDAYFLRDTVV